MWLARLGWKIKVKNLAGMLCWKIVWNNRICVDKIIEIFLDYSGTQISCKIWWNIWVEECSGKMGRPFCDKIAWTI